jgi:CheY-like chemotaxis protein
LGMPHEIISRQRRRKKRPVIMEVKVEETRQGDTQGVRRDRILIIEDNAYVREAFEVTLKRTALKALVVTTAEEAIEAVQQETFDIIICDYRLPGMDGIEFFNIAELYAPGAVKVLTSAYGFDNLDTESGSIPVDHFVLKPFSIHQLLLSLSSNPRPIDG